jgi:hypothetical protein
MKNILELAKELNIVYDKSCKKQNLINEIENYKKSNFLEEIETINANNINLIDIGINLKNEFNKLDITNIEYVLIENQISPIANRMKTIQGMVAQYFINKGIYNIEFISAANKLKLFTEKGKDTNYKERKKLSIEYTLNLLEKFGLNDKYKYMTEHKKKDDLSDCFLQGIYYLVKFNKINI